MRRQTHIHTIHHTYIPYIHAHIQRNRQSYIYIHKPNIVNIHTGSYTTIHAYMHSVIHIHMQSYKHKCHTEYIEIHTCRHGIRTLEEPSRQPYRHTGTYSQPYRQGGRGNTHIQNHIHATAINTFSHARIHTVMNAIHAIQKYSGRQTQQV